MKTAIQNKWFTLGALCSIALWSQPARASIAYGSINNFDTVNDTGHECHGFEIEMEDCHSTDVTYTFNYNHYGVPNITEDNSVAGHPKCIIRWESKKNPDGSWASFTAIPAGPIPPTNGHMFTNPAVNFGGEHFGAGYRVQPTAIRYNWLIDSGSGALVHGGAVQVSTPTFTYYPPAGGGAPAVQAVIAPPPPPVPEPKEFGKAVWVKEIRTTTHNNNEIKLRNLLSEDPDDPDRKNWRNGEPDEVETEWQILQKDYNKADAPNNQKAAAPEDLPGGDEVVTRRHEFYKYTGPLDTETGEAMGDSVGPDGIHGVGTKLINGVEVDLSTVAVVGAFAGSQMAAVDVDAPVGLIDHLGDAEEGSAYADRSVVVEGALPFTCTRDGVLPAGMTFDEVTGVLSGTPEESGEFNFKITASDGLNPEISKNFTLRVAAAGAVLPAESLLDTTASPVGAGTTTGDGSFPAGTPVTVAATAADGFHFVSWTEGGVQVGTSASYMFPVTADRVLVANFAPTVTYAVSTSAVPVAGGTTSGGGNYESGTSATVVAVPDPGYVFWKWTVGSAQVSTSRSYTFAITADRILVANFVTAGLPKAITASASPTTGGMTAGSGSYLTGVSATVVATPKPGYAFSKWQEGETTVSNSATYTFNVTGNRRLVANFTWDAGVTITTSSSTAIGGSTSGDGPYTLGAEVMVSAVANDGYAFVKWTESGLEVSTAPDFFFTADANRRLVAVFTPLLHIMVAAAPPEGGNPVSPAKTFSFTVAGNRSLVANFITIPRFVATPGAAGSNTLILSWPASAAGWTLQECADCASWLPSGRAVITVDDQNTVTVPTTEGRRFFRLTHP